MAKAFVRNTLPMIGKRVYVDWKNEGCDDWHWFELMAVDAECIQLKTIDGPEGKGDGGSWWYDIGDVKHICLGIWTPIKR